MRARGHAAGIARLSWEEATDESQSHVRRGLTYVWISSKA